MGASTTPLRDPAPRRLDASMDLLNHLRRDALDPGYSAAAAQGGASRRGGLLFPALLVVGLLFGIAIATTWRSAPAAAQERRAVIERIMDAEARLDQQRGQARALTEQVRDLRRSAGALDAAQQARVDLLGPATGADAVTGPAVRLVIDDGPDAAVNGSRVVDADLRMAANGLWASGAEAVAINGHRLSARSAIRNAGGAITVDYRSITRPYTVEAVGDVDALRAGFATTSGGVWLSGLNQHFGVSWRLEGAGRLTLGPDAGLGVDRATAVR